MTMTFSRDKTLFLVLLTLFRANIVVCAFQPPLRITHTTGSSTALHVSTSLFPNDSYVKPTSTSATTTKTASRTNSQSNIELRTYQHDGWTLKYRYKPATPGKLEEPPLLLVHPVGIGMSSWFWEKFMAEYQGGAVYAPDLIGCGIDNGSDAWNPEERGLFFPLNWVQGLEALVQQVILRNNKNNNPLSSILGNNNNNKVAVVTQGGLAPVGVMLAARNPNTVSQLVMTSPPTWNEMTIPVPEMELEKNYNFYKSPRLGKFAFETLESAWAIQFFSNLFLFDGKADAHWMDRCLQECRHTTARPPIQAFNAGLLQHRSYREELTNLSQPTLIVQGKADANRIPQRDSYATQMKDCTLVTLPEGLNVLPWERPALFAQTLQDQFKK